MTLLAARALWGAALVTAPVGIASAGVVATGSGSAVPASPAQGTTVLTADTLPPSATIQPPAIVQQQAPPAPSGAGAPPIQWPSVPVPAAPPPTTLPITGAITLSGSAFAGLGAAGSVSVSSNGMAISVTPGFGIGGDIKLSGTPNGSVPTNGLQVGITAKDGESFGPFFSIPGTSYGPLPAVSLKGTVNVPLFSVDPNLNFSLADPGNTSFTLEGSVKGIPFLAPYSGSVSTKLNSGSSGLGFDPTVLSSDDFAYTGAAKYLDLGSTAYVGPTFRIGLTWGQWLQYLSEVGNAEFMSQTGGQTLEDVLGPSAQPGQVTVSPPVTQPVPYLDFTTTPDAPVAPVNPITGVPDTAGIGPFGMMTPGTAQPTPNQVVADDFASLQAPPGQALPGAAAGNQQQLVGATSLGIVGTDAFGTTMQIPSQVPSPTFTWPAPPATGSPLPSRSDAGTSQTSDQFAAAQGVTASQADGGVPSGAAPQAAIAAPAGTATQADAASPAGTVAQADTMPPAGTQTQGDTVSSAGTAAQADATQADVPQAVVQADPPVQANVPQAVVQADPPQADASQAAAPQAVVQANPPVQVDPPPDQAPAPAATQVASAYDPTASYTSGA
jgi:nicotinate-nucleotide--dimethylbenzimidazole phosphoribosyltransferase